MRIKSRYDLLLGGPGKEVEGPELRYQATVDRKLNYSKELVELLIAQITSKLREAAEDQREVKIDFVDQGEKILINGAYLH